MQYNITINDEQVNLIQAGLDLLNERIIMSLGGMNELNKIKGDDPERKELINGSQEIMKEIEVLTNMMDSLSGEVHKEDFVKRKAQWKNKKKS